VVARGEAQSALKSTVGFAATVLVVLTLPVLF
jgi:hypothetical protein